MKNLKTKIFFTLFLSIFLVLNISAQKKEISKTFDGKKDVEIETALGSIIIKASNDGKVHLDIVHNYDQGEFDLKIKERTKKIVLEEDLDLNDGHSDGKSSTWTIAIPKTSQLEVSSGTGSITVTGVNSDIEGSTGTGRLEISDCNGEFELSSGTGNVTVDNCTGDFEVSSGTGNVKITGCEGNFEASSGTGKVRIYNSKGSIDGSSGTGDCVAENITMVDECEFSSGTGDAEVINPKGSNFTLEVSSGTGDAFLELGDAAMEGYFEFTAHKRKGRISSPHSFDKEEEFENGNDEKYERKSFTVGSSNNKFYINTGTGTAKLKK